MANSITNTYCPVCNRQIKVGKNGKIASHGKMAYVSDTACKGSGQRPLVQPALWVPADVESGSKAHLDALSKVFGL
jgi:hypothetical protein